MKGTYNSIFTIYQKKNNYKGKSNVCLTSDARQQYQGVFKIEGTQVLGNEEGALPRRWGAPAQCRKRHPNRDNAESKGQQPPIRTAGHPSPTIPHPHPHPHPRPRRKVILMVEILPSIISFHFHF